MKNNFTLRWTLANALGMSLGFLAFIQFLMFYEFGLNFEMHWAFGVDSDLSVMMHSQLLWPGKKNATCNMRAAGIFSFPMGILCKRAIRYAILI